MKKYKLDIDSKMFLDLVESKENYILNPIDKINKTKLLNLIEKTIGYKIKIRNSWLNKTFYTNSNNEFPWHNEKGIGNETVMPGEFSAIFWIHGNEEAGGSLDIIDDFGKVENIKFELGLLTIFPSTYLHRVNQYTGLKPRISFNINFDKL